MTSDFTALYASLDVDPDCDVDTLKHLFRRRIAELHPDRGAALSEEDLMMLYLEALRFHRRHGRFPGARVRGAAIQPRAVEEQLPRHEVVAAVHPDESGDDATRKQVMAVTLLTLLGLALLGLGIWAVDGADPLTAATGPPWGTSAG
ncbi:J domain-containing protein [Solilutibacter silvestris]|uniref:DnaJ domain-containing protein n=1 Tax=Solilutibacter silvestris TaxID=1645665 RepID=A0A2K1PZE1_9GAMM|nr:J domain-containing protein [Lysobacter silvestris]PNS08139.1 DnaJ domain-containing protein [Lysobacter silvestris]